MASNLHTAELLPSAGPSSAKDASRSKHAADAPDSVRTKYAWLALYFSLNLTLTLYNKAVMGKVPILACRAH